MSTCVANNLHATSQRPGFTQQRAGGWSGCAGAAAGAPGAARPGNRYPGRRPTTANNISNGDSQRLSLPLSTRPSARPSTWSRCTNTDPKGIVRGGGRLPDRPWGLYMGRPTPGRNQSHYLESWLLPALGLRANIFHCNRGHERDQDFCLDVGRDSRADTLCKRRITTSTWSCAPGGDARAG